MVKKFCMVGLVAAMAAAPAAFAGSMPAGSVGGYYSTGDANDADFDGFGIRGWASLNGPWFVHGEYGMLGFDGGGDVDALRIGGGFAGEIQKGAMWLAKAEYLMNGGDADGSGFGIHGGVMFMPSDQFGLFGTIGYLNLSDDNVGDDSAGLELNVGGKFSFTKEWAAVLDYRTYMGEYEDAGVDDEVNELRLGASYSFY